MEVQGPAGQVGKHAFLVASHTDPNMTKRLVRALTHPRVDVYLHVDRRVDPEPFVEPGVILVPDPIAVPWGGWGLVEATLRLLDFASSRAAYSHFTHLSGQDYLLRPVDEILGALERHPGQWVDLAWSHQDRSDRWSHYHIHARHAIPRLFQRGFRLFMRTMLGQPKYARALPKGIEYGCGSALWTLDAKATAWMLAFLRRRPDVVRFFKNTAHTSEFFVHCLMRSSPYRDQLGHHGHYIDWSAGLAHPKTLDMPDLDPLLSSGKIFARKFHSVESALLLDRLDQMAMRS